jgi:hypothetical protein
MDEFANYRKLWEQGVMPVQIYTTGKAHGLDEIALTRLLRTVCGLSLREVKKVIGVAKVWDRKQDVKVGATVYWEEPDALTPEAVQLFEARVISIEGDQIRLQPVARQRVTVRQVEDLPVDETLRVLPRATFESTIAERLVNVLQWRSQWAEKSRADLAHTE